MKDFKIYLSIAMVLLVGYLVAQYNRPLPVNWAQTLANNDKIPFGTYIMYHQLGDIFPGARVVPKRKPIYNVLDEDSVKNSSYVIIANTIDITKYDFQKLEKYMRQGNDVLLAAGYFGNYLDTALKLNTDAEFKKYEYSVKFANKKISDGKLYTVGKGTSDSYFSKFDTAKTVVLGSNDYNHVNFVRYNFGKGALYLNVNPLLFSNYSLLQPAGASYAATALSYLGKGKNILWDEYYTLGRDDDEALMRVFLRNRALLWSFYLSMFGLLIFVTYEMKRRQRIIPIIDPLANTTLDFVNVVGQVYYEQRDNGNIAQKKAAYFLEHIRAAYGLKTNQLNPEFADKLSQKSGVGLSLVREILNQVTLIVSGMQVSDRDLINLNQNIEQFYTQAR